MKERYKVILSNKNFYKEIELSDEVTQVKVGTDISSDVRLRKDLFFDNIGLIFEKKNNGWMAICSDNIYMSLGNVSKFVTRNLKHGDSISVKYNDSNIDVFNFFFYVDFDYENKSYNMEINIDGRNKVVIGGISNSDISISDKNISGDFFSISIDRNRIFVIDDNSKYGVFVNGSIIERQKEISNFDFISIANYSFYYKNGKLYTEANSKIKVTGLNYNILDKKSTCYEYPNLIRSTRIEYELPENEIEIKQPLPKPQKNKKNLILSLIPSIVMLALMVVMRGILGGGGTFVIYSVCSMGIGIIMSVVTYIYDGKDYKNEFIKRDKEYRQYIDKKEQEINVARDNELRIRNLINASLSDSINEVISFGKRIYEKTNKDKDFLDVYIGRGTVEANVPVKYTNQDFIDTEDPISMLPSLTEEKYHYIYDAPIVAKFNEDNGVGIVGNKNMLQNVMKNITLDLAIKYFYKEVKLYYIFDSVNDNSIDWLRWLRHAYNDEIGIRNFMCDEESRKILLENLYSVLSAREMLKNENQSIVFNTYYVIFVLDSSTIRKHPISKYIENCNTYGFTFIFFEENEELIPKGCNEIIRLSEKQNSGVIFESKNGDIKTEFKYNDISDSVAMEVALKLGAIDVEEVNLESELTKNISMYELLNIFQVDDLNLKERWEKSQVYKSMAAPLGVKTKNEIVYLDISDKANAHGPHGLVAGTTGSGKSEILQTYVLAMATLFHPYDVGFVIIDFKGGGMANQFKDLPHMMGAITNIDGREINRSLLSIKAELVKRQSLFAEAGVNHINDYIKLFKNGEVKQPLPHLIIIVDEFAELKAEYPDFMKELISAARIGRTLGVHLILATQKPAGVVDAQIWSNSKFKLCLKVQTKEDSNEVIKTPLAAEIVEPGRAYFQVGNNEIFELFQSAYSGEKVLEDGNDKNSVFTIYELNKWGKKRTVYTNKKKNQKDNARNQLQVIVDYVHDYCKTIGLKTLNGICLPPLNEIVKKNSLKDYNNTSQDIVVPIGIYDDPEKQTQGNYCINFSENNTYIIGSAMTGKTTLLQTILLQLMDYYTPSDVNVYIIDCGNMTLKVFEESNIVGGVAVPAEEDKVVNLFKLIFRIMDERKKIFSEKGLGTYSAYLETGYTDMPQIIIMIDNIAVFREYYDNLSDDFLSISREGNSLGISIVATATQTNAMNYKALSNYGTRIALVCNDTNEYMSLFDRCRMEPKDIPGRGLCVIDKRIMEFQTALCVDGDKEYIRVENIRKSIKNCNEKYENSFAQLIPIVPDIIKFNDIKNNNIYKENYKIPIGIDYNSVQYYMLDIMSAGLIATVGREKSGKTNFIYHLFNAINQNVFGTYTEAYVIDNVNRNLQGLKQFGFVQKYSTDINDLEAIIEYIEDVLLQRQENSLNDEEYKLDEEPLILLVIENSKFIDIIQNNKDLSTKFISIIKQLKKYKVAVIVSELENVNVPFNASEALKFIKENRKFIVFDELSNIKFFDVSVKQIKDFSKPLAQGDAFVCLPGDIKRIKTIYVERM